MTTLQQTPESIKMGWYSSIINNPLRIEDGKIISIILKVI